ncbi:YigZ family protein [Anaerocolumna sp. AGMB13020]|uniref:YigZ family protein n=1 Tax=Anaerocolumna sp. AGMB13020 TaxID=3081750 RepID=UPI002954F70A|nr:YigZ family protein [Anaerocolumna sp. AGMB13020]WOO38441.1 YigZ family protein [Anaerocolumna sp. AGMB13020]
MNESCRTIYSKSTGEVIVKKSRFIASVFPISSEEEALQLIEQVKKEHSGARHNCFAYVAGSKDTIKRLSDDGEPAKTAGLPIMDLILLEKLHNILIVVTRYFGGTLLGTGGLVHAYQSAAKEGIKNAVIIEKEEGWKTDILIDYTLAGKLKYNISQMGIYLLEEEYTDKVKLSLLIPTNAFDEFERSLLEVSAGAVKVPKEEILAYAMVNGNLEIFK